MPDNVAIFVCHGAYEQTADTPSARQSLSLAPVGTAYPMTHCVYTPQYRGAKSIARDGDNLDVFIGSMIAAGDSRAWKWTTRKEVFLSDAHGDPRTFSASLVASCGVRKTRAELQDFELTASRKRSNFIFATAGHSACAKLALVRLCTAIVGSVLADGLPAGRPS